MIVEGQCCGTCLFGTSIQRGSEHDVAEAKVRVSCSWTDTHPTPDAIYEIQTFMYKNQGQSCRCYVQRKPE
jgi:hypothetical protein